MKKNIKKNNFFYFSITLLLLSLPIANTNALSKHEPIQPIPLQVNVNKKLAALGKMLFQDKRLSKDNSISCESCHNLNKGGTDQKQFSTGINGTIGSINAPTVYNSGFNYRQFWDGRADTLEEQVAGPVHNPIEMGSNWEEVITKLSKDKNYIQLFSELYHDGLTGKNIQNAIANFERTLITPNSKFDQYLRGNKNAITLDEKKGYDYFKSYGCIACHQGVNVGGNMFQKFGVFKKNSDNSQEINKVDLGRYNVTKKESDKFVFKVPSLRMVSQTAPYFHDGSAKTLREAVDMMFEYQLGRQAPDHVKDAIVKFLISLAGTTLYQKGDQ